MIVLFHARIVVVAVTRASALSIFFHDLILFVCALYLYFVFQSDDSEEQIYREQIRQCSMSNARARMVLERLDTEKPYVQRVEFIEVLAALTSLFKEEVSKIAPGPNKLVKTLLWNAAAPHRLEFYLNNTRVRYMIAATKLSLLPSGTTSNESLHAELNNCFRQTQAIACFA